MHWNSVSDFFAMGGYGFYVWWSFGLTAAALLAEMWLVRRRHAQLIRRLADSEPFSDGTFFG
jgi:heme exporter protein D